MDSNVNAVIGDVVKEAPKGAVVIIESTISPGSIDRFVRPYVAGKNFKFGEDIKNTAEMKTVIENTLRCVIIAFANELEKICRHDNVHMYEVIKICNMHLRVSILNPAPGVSEHCIPVNPWFLVGDYPSLTHVISELLKANASMQEYVMERICEIIEESVSMD